MQTNTAANLREMTDRAAFERLALHVLRCAEPDCASVIRLGTNEQGETIVSPLDGFACVAGAIPPLYVAVESTTTDVAGLERKWLYDHTTYKPPKPPKKAAKNPPTEADDGDLRKAAREARNLRHGDSSVRCKVYLVTNQIVPAPLRTKVDQVARSLNVDCDVWEQSRISDYLDINPTGQYLRWKYLGAPAERLSAELLLEVGTAIHQQYGRASRIQSDPSKWIHRTLDTEVVARAGDSSARVVLLVGESGFGKTVAAYHAMGSWLARGAPALWIRAELLGSSGSLQSAIDAAVRDQCPTVAEHSVRSLASALGGERLLVAVDDINRCQAPGMLLRRLLMWSATATGVVLLCPIWPRFLDSMHLQDRRDVALLRVGEFAPSEADSALGIKDGGTLAAALHHDPFLIGIARALCESGVGVEVSTPAREVLTKYVNHELQCMSSGEAGVRATCDTSEHREAIERAARGALTSTNLTPCVSDVREWIGDQRLWTAMVEVLSTSGIVWTTIHERISYRHDRLRDHLLADALTRLLERGESCTALLDPYFAEISAEALVRVGVPDELLETLKQGEPLVLVAALGVVARGSDAEGRIAEALAEWFAEERKRHARVRVRFVQKVPNARRVAAAGTFNDWDGSLDSWQFTQTPGTDEWVLVVWMRPGTYAYKLVVDGQRWVGASQATSAPDGYGGFNRVAVIPESNADSRFALSSARARLMVRELARKDCLRVLDVSNELPRRDLDVLLARFRNGDVQAGVYFCESNLGDPTMGYVARADAVASVQRLHLDRFVGEFREVVDGITSDQERLGAIILAGYLGHADMIGRAGQAWRDAEARRRLLPQALWAQLRSPDPDFNVIQEMVHLYFELEDDDSNGAHISEKGHVLEFLRVSGLRVCERIVTWLLAQRKADSRLDDIVWVLLDGIDHPDAVETMARMAAEAAELARAKGGFSFGAATIGDNWERSGRQMSSVSTQRLQKLWLDEQEAESVRWKAFRLWRIGVLGQPDAIQLLRSVPKSSPLYDAAVRARARFGDATVEVALSELLSKESFGARVAYRVWGSSIMAVVDQRLATWGGSSDDSYALADLLMRAPVNDARKLLVTNWSRIRFVPRLLQAALAVGGDELERLVADAIAEWPENERGPLEHAVMHLEMGDEDGVVPPVDKGRIARLLPYADQLRDIDLWRLAELARKHGLSSWGRERIGPLLEETSRASAFPTESDVKRELDALLADEQHRHLRTQHFAEHAEERADGLYNVLSVLDDWLSANHTQGALELAANVIATLGQRSGIEILSRHSDLSKSGDIERLEDVMLLVRRASL